MSEYAEFDLPYGVSVDDLRYLRLRSEEPSNFEEWARKGGWEFHVEERESGSGYEAFYMLARPVSPSFDDDDVAALQRKIGIIDECDELMDGYNLWVERPGEANNDSDSPFTFITQTTRLFFDFEGLPTEKTMQVMENLLSAYTPESPIARLLIYFAQIKPKKTDPKNPNRPSPNN